ncbi:MAG TPA: peptide chain release factor N(5)-glutamine methyltransferase [Acidimicrobiales bacterium]|nr:peptide chain release factor N(5)-glutamine methyltransferase [Acidimicrobiales bacterium]
MSDPEVSLSCGPSWRSVLAESARALEDPREAGWIVQHASGLARPMIMSALDAAVPASVVARIQVLVERRRSGEPLQRVLGEWGFRGIEVAVDGRALVPRPETEIVVEQALAQLELAGPPWRVVDLGTGSGVIALSIASEHPSAHVYGTDASGDALCLAEENLARQPDHVRARVQLLAGDWFAALPSGVAGSIAVVVSNPPYLAEAEWPTLEPVVRDYDPYEALVAGETGLEAIAVLVTEAPRWLRPGGALVLEIAPHQTDAALALAAGGGYASATVVDDLAGRPRVLVARRGA